MSRRSREDLQAQNEYLEGMNGTQGQTIDGLRYKIWTQRMGWVVAWVAGFTVGALVMLAIWQAYGG